MGFGFGITIEGIKGSGTADSRPLTDEETAEAMMSLMAGLEKQSEEETFTPTPVVSDHEAVPDEKSSEYFLREG